MSGELSRPSYCTGYHSRLLYCSNTGNIALRLAEVQPPKTVATLSTVMSCFAFSAKVGQSEAPSWVTTWSWRPSTPPAALTSSIARSSAFFTATSLMAIVPLSECRSPTLMMEPTTPGMASEPEPGDRVVVGVAAVDPVTFLPHAEAMSASRQSSETGSNPYRCCERACFKCVPLLEVFVRLPFGHVQESRIQLGGPRPRSEATGRMLTAECFAQDSDL